VRREKVFSKRANDITDSSSGTPSSLSFSSSGKVLAIGFDNGELFVLDLETSEVTSAERNRTLSANKSPIRRLVWLQHISSNDSSTQLCQLQGRLKMWRQGGTSLVARTGMCEHIEAGMGESVENTKVETFLQLAAGALLLSENDDGTIEGYILGIFPLFSINAKKSMATFRFLAAESAVSMLRFQASKSRFIAMATCSTSASAAAVFVTSFCCDALSCTCRYHWLEHAAYLFLSLQQDLTRLTDIISGYGRKWKEATKVVIPKLGLLQSTLDGYQLTMNPIQFMYTIAHCGLWHPAAHTSFSQHWNEQGLARLRSAVDSTSHAIVKGLQMKAIPIATNIALRCR
jgi:hypothetical protein